MSKWKNRMPLIFIVLIGVFTPVASTLLFYLAPPSEHTASGDILEPQQLPEQWQLTGKWTLIYASNGDCDEACRRRLCQTRQLRRMLPGNYFRLQQVWLRPPGQTPPVTVTATADCGEERAAALADTAGEINAAEDMQVLYGATDSLPVAAEGLSKNDYLYLADPDGNLAMRFPPSLDTYQIRKDLKQLLKLSKGRKQYTR